MAAPAAAPTDLAEIGREMHALAAELFPLHRAWTGPGLRATLDRIGREVPLEVREVPSGTRVFDWEVPPEWSLEEAWIADASGRRILDVADSTLNVVGYSRPFEGRLPWRALRERVHTLPERPRWTPYRSAPFDDGWGFCMPHELYASLERDPDAEYDVRIDASLDPGGALAWGEVVLPGEREEEILVWAHVCHPSLANDNLSGVAVATALARDRVERPRRHTFRFVFAPTTIGALAWLWTNRERLDRVRHGLVLSGVGDPGRPTYKRSRRGDAAVDRAAALVLSHGSADYEVRDFEPLGYDERQLCSPGFDLPVGCLMRTPGGEYPEYHSSGDDLEFVTPESLADSWRIAGGILDAVDAERTWVSTCPWGEPRLGARGLFVPYGDAAHRGEFQRAVLWCLSLADGRHSPLDVAERSGIPPAAVRAAVEALAAEGLLAEPGAPGTGWAAR